MAQSYTSLWYHLVWSTKNREPFLKKILRNKLYFHFREYCKLKEYHLDQINGVEDHVHLLIFLKPTLTISEVVRNIKTDAYYWIKENKLIGPEFGWQDGYAAFGVSEKYLDNLKKYIQNQENHHKGIIFEDEIKFLQNKISS
jgi:putative transposase